MTSAHDMLRAEILDRLAAADANGVSTKRMSRMITTWALKQSDQFIQNVGTWNEPCGGYWEITGAQVGKILRRAATQDYRIVQTFGKGVAVFRWQPTLDAELARQAQVAADGALIEVWDRSDWAAPSVVVVRKQPVEVGGFHIAVLATFHVTTSLHQTPLLTATEAKAGAEQFAALTRRTPTLTKAEPS